MVYHNEDGSITSNAAPRTLIGDNAIIAAKDAEIARLTAAVHELESTVTKTEARAQDAVAQMRAERDEASAQVAAVAREAATVAYVCWQKGADAVCAEILKRIIPDATAALAARDAAMRNEGRRQAAIICNMSYGDGLRAAHAAILAALEPEGGE